MTFSHPNLYVKNFLKCFLGKKKRKKKRNSFEFVLIFKFEVEGMTFFLHIMFDILLQTCLKCQKPNLDFDPMW